jgi:cation:H+ antiporter
MVFAGGFILCAVIIFFAGKKLSYYGDLLAEKTGMGKAWIGLILMASVTSLPELMVGISSSAIVQSADLAVGDILGSCAFNLGILAIMDAFLPRYDTLLGKASPNHILAAALGIILISMVGVAIFLPEDIVLSSWIGFTSLSFIIIYFISIRLIYLNEMKSAKVSAGTVVENHSHTDITLKHIIRKYVLFALIIVAAALMLPYFADKIADDTGLGKSFVGTFFLAVSTSLPEIAVSIAAVRMRSLDLAVGNLFGSNLFNILILAIDDLFYTKGHILKDASSDNIISVFSAILMTAVAIIGLSFRTKGKRYLLAWDAALIFFIYIVNLILLYQFSKL